MRFRTVFGFYFLTRGAFQIIFIWKLIALTKRAKKTKWERFKSLDKWLRGIWSRTRAITGSSFALSVVISSHDRVSDSSSLFISWMNSQLAVKNRLNRGIRRNVSTRSLYKYFPPSFLADLIVAVIPREAHYD